MLIKKGFPEEDELILCTVTKIFPHGVFAKLDEYDHPGMIHISEVSPGRIRNIRDFVREGKRIVCRVLRVNQEKGHIDLSLRRVNEGARKEKVTQVKLEQKAEKIIEYAAKKMGKSFEQLHRSLFDKISQHYSFLYESFDDVVHEKTTLEKLGVEPALAKSVTEFIVERMKPSQVAVHGSLKLKSYAPDGIGIIKRSLQEGIGMQPTPIEVVYQGGGKYHITVRSEEYKGAEKVLGTFVEKTLQAFHEAGGEGDFIEVG